MTKNKKKLIRHYIRTSRAAFPMHYKAERQYLLTLKNKINAYADAGGDITPAALAQEFGEPKEHYIYYLESLDSAVLCRELKLSKSIKRLILLLCICILAVSAYIFIHTYQNYTSFMESEGVYWEEEAPRIISEGTTEAK